MARKGFISNYSNNPKSPQDRMINAENYSLHLRVAKIVRVDYESMLCDLVYLDGMGSEPRVPITQGYQGPRSFLGGMPTINDWVIVGYNKSGGLATATIVGFVPRGYIDGIKNDIIGVPESMKDVYKPLRFKMRKLYEGEIYASSQYGSEIYLDKDVLISNSRLTELLLKSSDQSIHMSAVNIFNNTTGVRNLSGIIQRNALIGDPEFILPYKEFPTYTDSDGNLIYVPNENSTINNDFPYGKETIDDDHKAFIEHRIEVKEVEDPTMPVTTSNSGVDVDSFYKKRPDGSSDDPLVVQVLGTLVGNDPNGDRDRYGMILKPRLFPDPDTFKGKLEEVGCVVDGGLNETTSLAAAYTLKFPNSGTAFYVNKQGKYFANVASSTTADPTGSGESAEINLTGHTKMWMGKNRAKQRSLSLSTAGGVYTSWGFDNEKARSWDATFRKGVSWNILGNDSDGTSWNMNVKGDVRHLIDGTRFTEIKGDDIRWIQGTSEDRIQGRKVNQYVSDCSTNYGGSVNETSVGHYDQTIGLGFSRTIASPDRLAGDTAAEKHEIKTGNFERTMFFGNKKETTIIGNHETNIGIGNKKVDIKAGNYSVRCTAGNIEIKTNFGLVDVKTNGQVTIEGKLGVMVKSSLQVIVEAPFVNIGKNQPLQGIVTGGPAGHKDYITGLPLIGSFSTFASAV